MGRSPPLRVQSMLLIAHFRLAFALRPHQRCLRLQHRLTRRLIMQKARNHLLWLLHLVGAWFQVLFHSAHSGSFHLSLAVLCSLSVASLYLALRGGPRSFMQNFTCIALLWIAATRKHQHYRPFTFFRAPFHLLRINSLLAYTDPNPSIAGLGIVRFRSPLLSESLLLFFPRLTEMFHFRRCSS